MKNTLLGIDIGTSSIKCNLFDIRGNQLLQSSGNYREIRGPEGFMEIDPETVWDATAGVIKDIIKKNNGKYSILAVGICAIMIMPVLLDNDLKAVRPVIHWLDPRPQKQFFKLKKLGLDGMISKYSGSALTGESTVNSLSWVRENEPENFKRLSKFILLKDYIRYRLTGVICSDFGDASGTQFLDTRKWNWSEELITGSGFKKEIFPELYKPCEIGGFVTGEAAAVTGMKQGTPVAVGSGDGITTIFGLGIMHQGQIGITVGSAGVVAAASEIYPSDRKFRSYIFCHPNCDRWYLLMATASSGEILRWYRQNIIRDSGVSFNDLDMEAMRSGPGSRGLLFLPYILGARNPHSNPGAAGAFLGIKYRHNRNDMTRALLEGICFELKEILEVESEILETKETEIREIKLSGGILKSIFWQQLLCDILGFDMVTTRVKELGTFGSAMIAATATKIYSSLEQAVKTMVRDDITIAAGDEHKELYEKKFRIFKEFYKILEPKFSLTENQ